MMTLMKDGFRDSTAGLKVLNDVDLLRNDPIAFIYAWRGTAVVFSLIWTLVVAICVSFVQWIQASVVAYLVTDWKYTFN